MALTAQEQQELALLEQEEQQFQLAQVPQQQAAAGRDALNLA